MSVTWSPLDHKLIYDHKKCGNSLKIVTKKTTHVDLQDSLTPPSNAFMIPYRHSATNDRTTRIQSKIRLSFIIPPPRKAGSMQIVRYVLFLLPIATLSSTLLQHFSAVSIKTEAYKNIKRKDLLLYLQSKATGCACVLNFYGICPELYIAKSLRRLVENKVLFREFMVCKNFWEHARDYQNLSGITSGKLW